MTSQKYVSIITVVTATLLLLLPTPALHVATLTSSKPTSYDAFAQGPTTNATFTPPHGYSQATQNPSFAIRIPFTDLGPARFEPQSISIPVGMSVMWFNVDQLAHSVTLDTSSSDVPQGVQFDSGMIAPGGIYVRNFSTPGVYNYFDSVNPSSVGRIKVGGGFEAGANMDMLIGGTDAVPFNPAKLQRVTFSFVPHSNVVTIPPDLRLTFNVTIANSTTTLYSAQYDDADGVLDLELVPRPITNITTPDFISWGPDLSSSTAVASDGVYHIQGPVLVNNDTYKITVSLVAVNQNKVTSPISDTFTLPPVSNATSSSSSSSSSSQQQQQQPSS